MILIRNISSNISANIIDHRFKFLQSSLNEIRKNAIPKIKLNELDMLNYKQHARINQQSIPNFTPFVKLNTSNDIAEYLLSKNIKFEGSLIELWGDPFLSKKQFYSLPQFPSNELISEEDALALNEDAEINRYVQELTDYSFKENRTEYTKVNKIIDKIIENKPESLNFDSITKIIKMLSFSYDFDKIFKILVLVDSNYFKKFNAENSDHEKSLVLIYNLVLNRLLKSNKKFRFNKTLAILEKFKNNEATLNILLSSVNDKRQIFKILKKFEINSIPSFYNKQLLIKFNCLDENIDNIEQSDFSTLEKSAILGCNVGYKLESTNDIKTTVSEWLLLAQKFNCELSFNGMFFILGNILGRAGSLPFGIALANYFNKKNQFGNRQEALVNLMILNCLIENKNININNTNKNWEKLVIYYFGICETSGLFKAKVQSIKNYLDSTMMVNVNNRLTMMEREQLRKIISSLDWMDTEPTWELKENSIRFRKACNYVGGISILPGLIDTKNTIIDNINNDENEDSDVAYDTFK